MEVSTAGITFSESTSLENTEKQNGFVTSIFAKAEALVRLKKYKKQS